MVLARQEDSATFEVVLDGAAARAFVEAGALVVQATQGARGVTVTVPVADVTSVGLSKGRARASALTLPRDGGVRPITLAGTTDVLLDLACAIADAQEALKNQR